MKKTLQNRRSMGHIICSLPNDLGVETCRAWQSSSINESIDEQGDEVNTDTRSDFRLVDLPFLPPLPCIESSHTVQRKRGVTCSNSETQVTSKKHKRELTSEEKIVEGFDAKISVGPYYICTSYRQTFFKHSVCKFSLLEVPVALKTKCIAGISSIQGKEWICNQCSSYLKKKQIPPCSIGNNLSFPEIPSELAGLTPLEYRLLSPRIPFMQMKELPRGGQLGIKGNVVNVPADVSNTVNVLPRNLDATETIPVKLKRSLSYKSHTAFENIRPQRFIVATEWLLRNSILFQSEGISLNKNWSVSSQINDVQSTCRLGANITANENSLLPGTSDSCNEGTRSEQQNNINKNLHGTESDGWTESDANADLLSGNMDTMMQPANYREFNRILSVAPGEGNTPLGMFQDKFSEFLSFPNIYCGQTRCDNNARETRLHYSTICKWELRNVDRRVANDVTNLFFKVKKLQIKQIADKVSLAIRKCKLKSKKFTAGELLCTDSLNNILKHDEGYRVLRSLRGSPPYWEKAKKDIFSMIKQLGVPTWFCSFSAAETKWLPLLRSLPYMTFKRNMSDEELSTLTWIEKNDLIKSDPVNCARYFE